MDTKALLWARGLEYIGRTYFSIVVDRPLAMAELPPLAVSPLLACPIADTRDYFIRVNSG